jgi:hypothetical protein
VRTLVITPCSAGKQGDIAHPARAADLADAERRIQVKARLAAFARPAIEMYTGTHHRMIMDGIQAVWRRWGQETMDITILSGGYGLLPANEIIIPYDVTFDEFDEDALAGWVDRLQIPKQTASLVNDYDLAFFLLSGRYLSVLDLPLNVPDSVQQIILTDQESLSLVPEATNIHPFVADGGTAARRWHVKAPHVRGFLFNRLCRQIVHHGPLVLEWLSYHPQDTERLFYKQTRWRPQMALW